MPPHVHGSVSKIHIAYARACAQAHTHTHMYACARAHVHARMRVREGCGVRGLVGKPGGRSSVGHACASCTHTHMRARTHARHTHTCPHARAVCTRGPRRLRAPTPILIARGNCTEQQPGISVGTQCINRMVSLIIGSEIVVPIMIETIRLVQRVVHTTALQGYYGDMGYARVLRRYDGVLQGAMAKWSTPGFYRIWGPAGTTAI
jgi:hypothetical protein